jgi:hypothetical protein
LQNFFKSNHSFPESSYNDSIILDESKIASLVIPKRCDMSSVCYSDVIRPSYCDETTDRSSQTSAFTFSTLTRSKNSSRSFRK